jgi:hypothetical protein
MTPGEKLTYDFKDANTKLCSLIVELLSPITAVKGFSCDFLIRIRNGTCSILPQPLYKGEGWETKFNARSSAPSAGKDKE